MGNIHKQLQLGQTVGLAELAAGFRLTVLAPEEAGPLVVEIGPDYVVLDDAAAGIKTRLPVHLITSVVVPAGIAPAVVPQPVAATPVVVEPVAAAAVVIEEVATLPIVPELAAAVADQVIVPDAVVTQPVDVPQAA